MGFFSRMPSAIFSISRADLPMYFDIVRAALAELLVARQEFVQWWVDQTHRHRQPASGFQYPAKVVVLKLFELFQRPRL